VISTKPLISTKLNPNEALLPFLNDKSKRIYKPLKYNVQIPINNTLSVNPSKEITTEMPASSTVKSQLSSYLDEKKKPINP
jgi:hypothetical protein